MDANTTPDQNDPRRRINPQSAPPELDKEIILTPRSGAPAQVDPDLVGDLLYERASQEIRNRPREELIAIRDGAHACIESYLAGNNGSYVSSDVNGGCTRLFVATDDKPFIVSTMAEIARSQGVKVLNLLHPCVELEDRTVSLCYVELPALGGEQRKAFEARVKEGLEDLSLLTQDFEAMSERGEELAKTLAASPHNNGFSHNDIAGFLRWLKDENFIYLGYARWDIDADGGLQAAPDRALGVFKSQSGYQPGLTEESRGDCQRLLDLDESIRISKTDVKSPVHRMVKTSDVVVRELSPRGEPVAVHSFVGLLTSKALNQETSSVPLIKTKLRKLIRAENLTKNSHDYKNIVDIVDGMPKEEALRLDLRALRDLVAPTVRVQNRGETSLSMTIDTAKKEGSALVSMFRERFNESSIPQVKEILEKRFGAPAGTAEHHVDITTYPFARLYVHLPQIEATAVDREAMERQIADLLKTWSERLADSIVEAGFLEAEPVRARYENAFSDQYKAACSAKDCVTDIRNLELLSKERPFKIDLDVTKIDSRGIVPLSLYTLGTEVTISKALPILENAGFEVLSERCAKVEHPPGEGSYINTFTVRAKPGAKLEQKVLDEIVEPGLESIFLGRAENDPLNSLMIGNGMNLQQVGVLRTYGSMLWQFNRSATKPEIASCMVAFPELSKALVEMAEVKFDPARALSKDARLEKLAQLEESFQEKLKGVKDIQQDRVFRNLLNLLQNSVRSNLFQDPAPACGAIKLHSRNVEFLPQPRPLYEIFVYSPDIEGIHIRGGMVARGGIRWSERLQDYRTEVEDLQRTQDKKNCFIVPRGGKGGFVLKNAQDVKEGYSMFIRALLSVTDNREGGAVAHPKGLIVYDKPDPYFVVAADKGTAKFSDLANQIARDEFKFWLGDAFASGGSNGYDHKALGITARGAWECAKRHFKSKGVDFENTPFTVVGIGDMSGDVFGNGLLQSDKMKLVGAFNHKHIFIDPAPDPERSFAERQRLFSLPRSQWSDYDRSLISKGGGIYDRSAKEIEISDEAREALGIPADAPRVMNGEQLITYVMKSQVDLLWNGGIGTYVKSSNETNAEVGDGTNDRVRINASELRAKVVAEGGNLGFTQEARIEYSRNGGAINTDAIDNSGGVGMSDIEVNIKILLTSELRAGRINESEYKQLIAAMSSEAVDKVLHHNQDHALTMTIAELRSQRHLEHFQALLASLSRDGYVNRAVHHLPSDEEFQDRARKHEGLTRPELSVCLAGVKMWTKDLLLSSDLLEDPMTQGFLYDYFPTGLRQRFPEAIADHALRREIVATQIANYLTGAVGMTFVHRISQIASVPPTAVVKAGLASDLLLDASHLRSAVACLDTQADSQKFLECRGEIHQALRDVTAWLVDHHGSEVSPKQTISSFKDSFITLVENAGGLFRGQEKEIFDRRIGKYKALGLDNLTSSTLALGPAMPLVLEMLWISKESGKDIKTTASVFTQILSDIGLTSLLERAARLQPDNKWEKELLEDSNKEIRSALSGLAMRVMKEKDLSPQGVSRFLRSGGDLEYLRGMLAEIKQGQPTPAALAAVVRQLKAIKLPAASGN